MNLTNQAPRSRAKANIIGWSCITVMVCDTDFNIADSFVYQTCLTILKRGADIPIHHDCLFLIYRAYKPENN